MQLENRRADDFLLVLYTPARMFFNCTGIPGLGQDCMRIVDCNGIGVIVCVGAVVFWIARIDPELRILLLVERNSGFGWK